MLLLKVPQALRWQLAPWGYVNYSLFFLLKKEKGDLASSASGLASAASLRRLPSVDDFGGPVSSGFAVVTTFAPAPARSLGGSSGADVDCGLHRRHTDDGTCAGFVVDGWQVWFPPSAS